MADLTMEQVAQAAYDAGFRGESLATAVAIAQGESGLRSHAVGDTTITTGKWGPSVGLFQIRTLNAEMGTGESRDISRLGDPRFNAQAAFEISSGGTNFQPWSVFKHGIHLQYLDQARALVQDYEARGIFAAGAVDVPQSSGIDFDYGQPQNAADLASAADSSASLEDQRLQVFLESAVAQRGDPYVFGAVASGADDDPDAFDCAELVQWAAGRAGIQMTTGSWLQYQEVHAANTTLTVEEALRTPGALLFHFSGGDPLSPNRPNRSHVAISLGDGTVMEARSTSHGVDIFDAVDRNWTHAGTVPGMGTTLPGAAATTQLEEIPYDLDSDGDGLRDRYERFIGTDPFSADTDRDGYADVDELTTLRTDPLDYLSNPLGGGAPGSTFRPPLTNADELLEPAATLPRITIPPAPRPTTPQPTPAPPPEPAAPETTDELSTAAGDPAPSTDPAGDEDVDGAEVDPDEVDTDGVDTDGVDTDDGDAEEVDGVATPSGDPDDGAVTGAMSEGGMSRPVVEWDNLSTGDGLDELLEEGTDFITDLDGTVDLGVDDL